MTESEFLKALADIRDYWLSVPKESLYDKDNDECRVRMNGMIFSMLSMFDGVSSLNDFVPITLVNGVDSKYGSIINRHFDELHAKWGKYE